jgi:hypothetical protein
MDSLVDLDILALSTQDGGASAAGVTEAVAAAHETDADLELYKCELADLQLEVRQLKLQSARLQRDINLCVEFTGRVDAFTRSILPPPPPPKAKAGGSKWGILKSSILAQPVDISATTAATSNVHLPVQPDYAKFLYLAEKLEMARRTSKFIGIRAKAPRAEYVEKSVALRSLVLNNARERSKMLVEDTAAVRKLSEDAAVVTLSILEHQQSDDGVKDRPFDLIPLPSIATGRAPVQAPPSLSPSKPVPPPPPALASAPKQVRGSVTFATNLQPAVLSQPPPPALPASPAKEAAPPAAAGSSHMGADDTQDTKRGSVLHSFRSRSNSAAVSRTHELNKSLDPQLAAFEARAALIANGLVHPSAVQMRPLDATYGDVRCEWDNEAAEEFKEALQAHCSETLTSFQAEMDGKMRDCLEHCQQALRRRTGTLAEMKGKV